MTLNRSASVLAAILLVLICAACGGSERGASAPEVTPPKPGSQPLRDSIAAPQQLFELLHEVSAGRTTVLASNFAAELPHPRVEPDAELLRFSPAGSSLDRAAYAFYVLDSTDLQGSWSLYYEWQELPSPLASAWIGLGDVSRNAWDWRPVTGLWETRLNDIARYRNADGRVLVAVLATGSKPSALASLGFKTPLAYDELEENDSRGAAQQLPSLPLHSFRGSIGSAPGYAGADGDSEDWYRFAATPGKYLNVVLRAQGGEDDYLQLYLWKAGSEQALKGEGGNQGLTIDNLLLGEEIDEVWLSVTALEGGLDYELSVLESEAENEQPVAVISSSAKSGPPGLLVNFDGSASTAGEDSDSIVRYDWDFDGDGIFDQQGPQAQAAYRYRDAGVFHPSLRVIDSHGMPSEYHDDKACTALVAIAASFPHDEREDNELGPASWDRLPAVPFNGFSGSIGPGAGADDGDRVDMFVLSVSQGEAVSFRIDFDPLPAGEVLVVWLYQIDSVSGNEWHLTGASGNSSIVVADKAFADHEVRLELRAPQLEEARDYSIRAVHGLPPEVELIASPDHAVPPFVATLSATGSDVDGQPLEYVWDLNGDGVYEFDSAADNSLELAVDELGLQTVAVRARDADGLLSQPVEVKIHGLPRNYDEVEDNDNDSTATPLGNLPVIGFTGNIGFAPDAPSYDGDNQDSLLLPDGLSSADALKFIVNFDQPVNNAMAFTNGEAGLQDHSDPTRLISVYSLRDQPGEPYVLRLTGYEFSDYSLDVLRSDVPLPALSISPTADPLTYQLDASASSDSDGIAAYRFKFDPTGNSEEVDNGAIPILLRSFSRPGRYLLDLTVQDNFGAVSNQPAYYLINAGNVSLGETENNDSASEAQPLPAFPFSDFYGNLGDEAGIPATDGDSVDCYSFTASPGQTVNFSLLLTAGPRTTAMQLYDAEGNHLSGYSPGSLSYTFGSETGPFVLKLQQLLGAGFLAEYVMSGTLSGP